MKLQIKSTEEKEKEKKEQEERQLLELLREPAAQKAAIDAANEAVKQALLNGQQDQANEAARQAMLAVLAEYRPETVTLEQGLKQALKLRDEFLEREIVERNLITQELDINDFPNSTRQKATAKEELDKIAELTQCEISVRG